MNHRQPPPSARCRSCGHEPRAWATDKLTGLLDRWGWDAEAGRALAAARRRDEPAALVLLDLDHFKRINDTLGHPAGDRVLRAVASVLRQVCEHAVLGRYGGHGGDEFLAFLPGADLGTATALAATLRAEVGALQVPARTVRGPRTVTDLTVSVGLATHCPGARTRLADLVLAADAALLAAKHAGRNRVHCAQPALGRPA
ncbi:GGDEF domain-containing protein [Crossiella sp. CA-258035]|uniref:GGDEF domain-containing protein n=1 Tax=Crossiella sp. CA-258035 TaxID=2981138 RepID=UPI0024BCC745|nr:GGDEF domain-containing protein [Crossiella sp. CA-258035]WHT17456.1 GGDEF domain-containing protein [Crossiella sp. CA-258035]